MKDNKQKDEVISMVINLAETCGIVALGILLLRVSGRKSVAQMTIGSTVVMLMIGTILASPIAQRGYWATMLVTAVAIGTLIAIEYLELKFHFISKLISGEEKIVIIDGEIQMDVLRKTRIPIAKLYTRLRQSGISDIRSIHKGTIEINGDLGYELKKEAQPLTIGEFEQRMEKYMAQMTEHVQQVVVPSLESRVHLVDKDDLLVHVATAPSTMNQVSHPHPKTPIQ